MNNDITGQKFNKLTAIKRVGSDKNRRALWLCKCDCGKEFIAAAIDLRAGRVKSCGCYHSAGISAAKKADKINGTSLGHIRNVTVYKNSRSGVRGVSWNSRKQKWRATIKFKGKQKELGLYDSLEAAKEARKEAEEEIYGGFLEDMENRKITDLLDEALNCTDYDKRINFLLAGMISEEANDTPEKEEANMAYLREIFKYCIDYRGDKSNYIKRVANIIKQYISPEP